MKNTANLISEAAARSNLIYAENVVKRLTEELHAARFQAQVARSELFRIIDKNSHEKP